MNINALQASRYLPEDDAQCNEHNPAYSQANRRACTWLMSTWLATRLGGG